VRVVIAAVGRVKEPEYRALLDEYYGRTRRYCALDEVEVREEREDRVRAGIEKAAQGAGGRGVLVALDVEGRGLSSEAFAKKLGEMLDRAEVPVFAIGGADGLPQDVRKSAAWKLSLGPMTLPHRLARLVLAEQVYRAFTILKGEPYNR
jgi:23S rRNA (pseudouridine1915-N3)-methyltransferase